jgi:hypothetical protein
MVLNSFAKGLSIAVPFLALILLIPAPISALRQTMEMVLAEAGSPKSLYLDYLRRYKQPFMGNQHEPIEEALANAYAFNAFSFISRVKKGYVDGLIRIYHAVLEKYWAHTPPGYRDAINYVKGGHFRGAALLLRKIVGIAVTPPIPLEKIAAIVFPSGFAAFVAKPEIPT